MKVLLFAAAFLLISIGIAIISAIPLLFSWCRRNEEVASALNVSTQFQVKRYNALLESYEQAAKARGAATSPIKRPNLQPPLKVVKNGPRKDDDNLPKP